MHRLQTLWEQAAFRAGPGVGLNKSEFIGKVTATYMEDPIAFKQHIQAAYVDLFSMYDSDMNCKLAKDEFIIGLRATAHFDILADLRYFSEFKKADGIPLVDLIEAYVKFHTNDKNIDEHAESFDRLQHTELWISNGCIRFISYLMSIK